jgi:hypothetical protein
VVNATPRPLYRRERHGTHFGTTYLMNYLNWFHEEESVLTK